MSFIFQKTFTGRKTILAKTRQYTPAADYVKESLAAKCLFS